MFFKICTVGTKVKCSSVYAKSLTKYIEKIYKLNCTNFTSRFYAKHKITLYVVANDISFSRARPFSVYIFADCIFSSYLLIIDVSASCQLLFCFYRLNNYCHSIEQKKGNHKHCRLRDKRNLHRSFLSLPLSL